MRWNVAQQDRKWWRNTLYSQLQSRAKFCLNFWRCQEGFGFLPPWFLLTVREIVKILTCGLFANGLLIIREAFYWIICYIRSPEVVKMSQNRGKNSKNILKLKKTWEFWRFQREIFHKTVSNVLEMSNKEYPWHPVTGSGYKQAQPFG